MPLENAPEAEAAALAAALESAGLAARTIPQDRLPALPDAEPAKGAALENGSIRWKTAAGDASAADADALVLAAAAYRQETTRTVTATEGPTAAQQMASLGIKLATGLPINLGGKKREVTKTERSTELVFHLELLFGSPLRRVRVDAGDFDFSCLGAAMQYAALPNFRTLLAALRDRLPRARLNLGARVLLAGQPVNTMGYERAADLEREERWLLALSIPG